MSLKDRFINRIFGSAIEAQVKLRLSEELTLRAAKQKEERIVAATAGDTPMDTIGGDIGWRRLTTNLNRDLYPVKQDRMIEIAYWEWENNPLAHFLIETTVDFLLADGMPFECEDPNSQEVLEDFWFDPINQMDIYFHKFVRELWLYGEQCYPAFVAEQTGKVRLGYIDPIQIYQVITDPENVKIPIGVIIKSLNYQQMKTYKTILPQEAEAMLSDDAQRFRENYNAGECFYFAVNNVTNSPRGRSDLMTVADFLDAYENFLFNYTDKWDLMNSFVWDIEMAGADEKRLTEELRRFTKKSGSVYAHNEKVKLNASAPKLGSAEATDGARLFRNHILGKFGYPSYWFGGGEDANRAIGVEMGTPAFKKLSAKQRITKMIWQQIFRFVVYKSIEARYNRPTPGKDPYAVKVITPELTQKDIAKAGTTFQSVITSVAQAVTQKWIDVETAQKVTVFLLGYLGMDVTVEEIQERLAKQIEDEATQDYKASPAPQVNDQHSPGPGIIPLKERTTPPSVAEPATVLQ